MRGLVYGMLNHMSSQTAQVYVLARVLLKVPRAASCRGIGYIKAWICFWKIFGPSALGVGATVKNME